MAVGCPCFAKVAATTLIVSADASMPYLKSIKKLYYLCRERSLFSTKRTRLHYVNSNIFETHIDLLPNELRRYVMYIVDT